MAGLNLYMEIISLCLVICSALIVSLKDRRGNVLPKYSLPTRPSCNESKDKLPSNPSTDTLLDCDGFSDVSFLAIQNVRPQDLEPSIAKQQESCRQDLPGKIP